VPSLPLVGLAGAAIGLLTGLFGVGGSSIATPVLSMLGTSPLAAVASPLPATIPSAIAAAIPYVRAGENRPRAAMFTLLGAVPGTIVGALLSHVVGGQALLVASGVVLVVVGARIGRPIEQAKRDAGTKRRQNRPLLLAASFGVGLFTGLLANGGGFLLVPLYVLIFGLRMRQAVATSLTVIAVLAVPTLIVHWSLGHIDWAVAGAFAAGSLPAAAIGGRFAQRFEGPQIRRAFGWFLMISGAAFVIYRVFAR
jgi:uncharacterized membrane protein YfcA